MPLIVLIAALAALRFFEVWHFADLSWWVIAGLVGVAFLWFEYIEKILGLDKKKEHQLQDRRRAERVRKTLDKRR